MQWICSWKLATHCFNVNRRLTCPCDTLQIVRKLTDCGLCPPACLLWSRLSPQVQPIDYESFSKAYGTLLKSSMTTLRKKYKKKNPTAATTASKRKPGGGNTTATAGPGTFSGSLVKVVGPRRGAGVEKRRALVRRRERQVARAKARRKQASR